MRQERVGHAAEARHVRAPHVIDRAVVALAPPVAHALARGCRSSTERDDGYVRGTLGGGTGRLSLATDSGDVSLTRLE